MLCISPRLVFPAWCTSVAFQNQCPTIGKKEYIILWMREREREREGGREGKRERERGREGGREGGKERERGSQSLDPQLPLLTKEALLCRLLASGM